MTLLGCILRTAWDSTFLDALDIRLQRLEEKLNWFADRFICDGHPLTSERDRSESVARGLKNITNMSKNDYVPPVAVCVI